MKKAKKRKAVAKAVKHPAKIAVDPATMSGEDFRTCLEKLAISQSAFARLINVGDRTVRSWIAEVFPVPKPIAFLVRLMIKTKTAPGDLTV